MLLTAAIASGRTFGAKDTRSDQSLAIVIVSARHLAYFHRLGYSTTSTTHIATYDVHDTREVTIEYDAKVAARKEGVAAAAVALRVWWRRILGR